jgi:type IV secretory pathway VirB4 component
LWSGLRVERRPSAMEVEECVSYTGLPQYLNYLRMVDEGVMEMKDDSLGTCFAVWGKDLEYAPYGYMNWIADHVAQELRLTAGWMIEGHTLRIPVAIPPSGHHCQDPTSTLFHEEEAQRYAASGVHFEDRHVLAIAYRPPDYVQQEIGTLFFEGRKHDRKRSRD